MDCLEIRQGLCDEIHDGTSGHQLGDLPNSAAMLADQTHAGPGGEYPGHGDGL